MHFNVEYQAGANAWGKLWFKDVKKVACNFIKEI